MGSLDGTYRLSVMILILLFVSELLTDDNAFLSDQILHAVALLGNSGGDGSSLVLVLALVVHVVGLAVLVLAGPLSRATVRRSRCYPLEADEQGLQAGNTANGDGDEIFDDGPNHKVGETPDIIDGGEEAVEVEGADNSSGTSTVRSFC